MLVRTGIERLAAAEEQIVLVVGDPYYGRFGFAAEAARCFASPYAGPYLQALPLVPDAPRCGAIRYPAAFDLLA